MQIIFQTGRRFIDSALSDIFAPWPELRVTAGPREVTLRAARFANGFTRSEVRLDGERSFEGVLEFSPEASVGFTFEGVNDEDLLLVRLRRPRRADALVRHAQSLAKCTVRCASGHQGHPCVDCKVGDAVVRVCC